METLLNLPACLGRRRRGDHCMQCGERARKQGSGRRRDIIIFQFVPSIECLPLNIIREEKGKATEISNRTV